ncbi:MAG: pilus assembly protein TadG-related protein [Microbacterium sp.]|uniref:pilus assembly protein TadG-related protein n=1 Tax=Microbacterium sp. TaxID=51671 RepID=UPI0027253DCF|nr:pilus assembly protein TadG-related protein [Microbacterium sp.]MDO8383923.1 pilus assembly protein TadG-related protein [Microbacterium sp.]
MTTIRQLLRKLRDDERGSITPFFVVFVPALVLIVGLVVDGAGKIQANENAQAIASGASRAAANAVAAQVVSNGGISLDNNRARTAATDYIEASGMTGTVNVVGNRITVSVETSYSTKFVSIIGIATLPAEATATAEIITQ